LVLGLVVVGPTARSVVGRIWLVSNGSYTWHKLALGVEPVDNGLRGPLDGLMPPIFSSEEPTTLLAQGGL
jgi:hypothetical protein